MSEVVPIDANMPVPDFAGEPVECCVAELERLLEAARSGQIIGIVVAAKDKDLLAQYSIVGRVSGYGLLGALVAAQHALLREYEDD